MKILIVGAFGYGNLGDNAIRDIELELFSEFGEVAWDSPPMDMKKVNSSDVLILGGGGIIYDANPHKLPGEISLINVNNYCGYAEKFLEKDKPVIIFCVGEQGIQTYEAKKRYRDIMNRATIVSTRSIADTEILYSIGVQREIITAADPAIMFSPARYNVDLTSRRVCCVATSGFKGINMCQTAMTFSKRDDTKTRGKFGIGWWSKSARDFVDFVADKADIVISGRFHGGILTFAAGKPAVLLWGQNSRFKNAKLAREYKWDFVTDVVDHNITLMLDKIFSNYDEVLRNVYDIRQKMRQKVRNLIEEIATELHWERRGGQNDN